MPDTHFVNKGTLLMQGPSHTVCRPWFRQLSRRTWGKIAIRWNLEDGPVKEVQDGNPVCIPCLIKEEPLALEILGQVRERWPESPVLFCRIQDYCFGPEMPLPSPEENETIYHAMDAVVLGREGYKLFSYDMGKHQWKFLFDKVYPVKKKGKKKRPDPKALIRRTAEILNGTAEHMPKERAMPDTMVKKQTEKPADKKQLPKERPTAPEKRTHIEPAAANLDEERFMGMMRFFQLAPNILAAETEEDFLEWFSRLEAIDQTSLELYLRKFRERIPKNFMKLAEQKLEKKKSPER